MGKMLTIQQVAEQTTLSRRSVQRLVKTHELPHYRVCNRVRFSPGDVDRFLSDRFVPARS